MQYEFNEITINKFIDGILNYFHKLFQYKFHISYTIYIFNIFE